MLKSLYDFSLLDLLPDSLTKDPQIRACVEGLDEELRKLSTDIRETLILSRIDELSEDVLDLLAWQFHLDFYQPAELNIETKRALIRESIADHRIRGTPAAVEKLLTTVFNNAVVKEWYEYGGEPYTFRIEQLGKNLANESDFADFELALNIAKNARSHLESFIIRLNEILEIFLALIESRVEIRESRYLPTFYPELMTNYLGFTNSSAIYRKNGHQIDLNIPQISANLGFMNQRAIKQFVASRAEDKPKHDLRSTSILDLLMLDLGILLEGTSKPQTYWIFQDAPALPTYIGFFNAQNVRVEPLKRIRQSARLNQTLGILNHRLEKKHQYPSKTWKMSLELGYWIHAAQIILQESRMLPESPSDAVIHHSEKLNLYTGIAHQTFENRVDRPRLDFTSSFTNFVGFIICQSIIQHAYSKDLPTESIVYQHTDFLNLYTGIGRFLFEEKKIVSIPRLFSRLNLAITFGRSEFHRQHNSSNKPHLSLKTEPVYIGFINWFRIYQHAGTKSNTSFYTNSETLKLYQGFSEMKVEHRSERNHDDLKIPNLSLTYGMLNSRVILQHSMSPDSIVDDSNLKFTYNMNLKAGLIDVKLEDIRENRLPIIHSTIRNNIGIMNFQAIIQKAYSREKPNLPDEHVESRQNLMIYNAIVNIRSEEFKNRTQYKSQKMLKMYHGFLNVRLENQRLQDILAVKEKITANVGIISQQTEIRQEKSDYRLDSIPPWEMKLPIYEGFVWKGLASQTEHSRYNSHEKLRISAGIAGITFISQVCRTTVVRNAPTVFHNRHKTKLVIFSHT